VCVCVCVCAWQKAKKVKEKKRTFKAPPYKKKDRFPIRGCLRILYYYPEPLYF
jgi:hypothetical protein